MDLTSLTVFLQAAVIGVLIAAPVGPIGLLTMQRTLERGLAAGLATGLGAAAADAVYGAVGAFSVRWLIDGLTQASTSSRADARLMRWRHAGVKRCRW